MSEILTPQDVCFPLVRQTERVLATREDVIVHASKREYLPLLNTRPLSLSHARTQNGSSVTDTSIFLENLCLASGSLAAAILCSCSQTSGARQPVH